jgi:hypothetical protein
MSYRGLWRFFHGEEPFDAERLGLTLPQFRTFFEHLSLELTVVDSTGASILDACHTPQRANRKLNPRHVWVAHHDEHLFHLNSGLKSLSQLPRSVLSAPIDALEELEHEVGPPSAHFFIPRTSAPVTFIERLDDLTTLDLSGPAAVVRVACPVEMSVALYELVTRCSYLPGITMRAGAIAALRQEYLSELAAGGWVVRLHMSFQDAQSLFLVMDPMVSAASRASSPPASPRILFYFLAIPCLHLQLGGDLMQLLIKRDVLDEETARFVAAELVAAIGACHARGYIHRDIKPDNVL